MKRVQTTTSMWGWLLALIALIGAALFWLLLGEPQQPPVPTPTPTATIVSPIGTLPPSPLRTP